MKTKLFLLIFISILTLTFNSCKEEEEDTYTTDSTTLIYRQKSIDYEITIHYSVINLVEKDRDRVRNQVRYFAEMALISNGGISAEGYRAVCQICGRKVWDSEICVMTVIFPDNAYELW